MSYALGYEMEGLGGWTYPYQRVLIDDAQGEILGLWKQVADATRPDGSHYEIAGLGGSWFRYAGDFKWSWQRDFFDVGNATATFIDMIKAGVLTPGMTASGSRRPPPASGSRATTGWARRRSACGRASDHTARRRHVGIRPLDSAPRLCPGCGWWSDRWSSRWPGFSGVIDRAHQPDAVAIGVFDDGVPCPPERIVRRLVGTMSGSGERA